MGRIVHSAGFRRLQGKTQVMGVGEGDFHRTRLTHSLEAAQIGTGLLRVLHRAHRGQDLARWLPSTELLLAACFAHDIGHPPFGHGGERALQACMRDKGGFEGNAQTLRTICKLEKYKVYEDGRRAGINPTRRTVLAVLKYPVAYSLIPLPENSEKPPKCHYDTESEIVEWAIKPFSEADRIGLKEVIDGKTRHKTLDASIMELSDDIAYAVHDLEDIVAREMVSKGAVRSELDNMPIDWPIKHVNGQIQKDEFTAKLFDGGSAVRKRFVGNLVGVFASEVRVQTVSGFTHPLLAHRISMPEHLYTFLKQLEALTYGLVITEAEVQQLERRGQRLVTALFEEFMKDPDGLIPSASWSGFDPADPIDRRVCDYVAGMTDSYAERIYHRLFTPGFGSSRDEL